MKIQMKMKIRPRRVGQAVGRRATASGELGYSIGLTRMEWFSQVGGS